MSIEGVVIAAPKVVRDERGAVRRFLRTDDSHFKGFGEVYFSEINPGIVKGWKRHLEMTMTLTVAQGSIVLVLYDDREGSATKGRLLELFLDHTNPQVIVVPPMIWTGFKGLGQTPSLLCNCASILHHPDEAQSLPINAGPVVYDWTGAGV